LTQEAVLTEMQPVSIMERGTDLNWSVTLTFGQAHPAESQRLGA
jgi:hypothetical protein